MWIKKVTVEIKKLKWIEKLFDLWISNTVNIQIFPYLCVDVALCVRMLLCVGLYACTCIYIL